MARYAANSIHHEKHDTATASAYWHKDKIGGAWLTINVDSISATFHGSYLQLTALRDAVNTALDDLAVTVKPEDTDG